MLKNVKRWEPKIPAPRGTRYFSFLTSDRLFVACSNAAKVILVLVLALEILPHLFLFLPLLPLLSFGFGVESLASLSLFSLYFILLVWVVFLLTGTEELGAVTGRPAMGAGVGAGAALAVRTQRQRWARAVVRKRIRLFGVSAWGFNGRDRYGRRWQAMPDGRRPGGFG